MKANKTILGVVGIVLLLISVYIYGKLTPMDLNADTKDISLIIIISLIFIIAIILLINSSKIIKITGCILNIPITIFFYGRSPFSSKLLVEPYPLYSVIILLIPAILSIISLIILILSIIKDKGKSKKPKK